MDPFNILDHCVGTPSSFNSLQEVLGNAVISSKITFKRVPEVHFLGLLATAHLNPARIVVRLLVTDNYSPHIPRR